MASGNRGFFVFGGQMPTSPKRSAAAANAAADAMAALLNGGSVKIYAGSVPADVATALSGQTLLGTLALGNPAFGGAVNGVATANPITDDSSADADGIAAFFRACNSGG